jgi:hypothetical protein
MCSEESCVEISCVIKDEEEESYEELEEESYEEVPEAGEFSMWF